MQAVSKFAPVCVNMKYVIQFLANPWNRFICLG